MPAVVLGTRAISSGWALINWAARCRASFDLPHPVGVVGVAVGRGVFVPAGDGPMGRTAEGRHGRMVEIGPAVGHRHLAAERPNRPSRTPQAGLVQSTLDSSLFRGLPPGKASGTPVATRPPFDYTNVKTW